MVIAATFALFILVKPVAWQLNLTLFYLDRTKHTADGSLHTSMSGSCGVCVDGVLYLFGGHHARGNTNRVQFINIEFRV